LDEYIRSYRPDLICFTAVSTEYPFIENIAKHIKLNYPGIYLLIGGPHVSIKPACIPLGVFDALCVGEGEYATLDLASQLENG
jgi:anaerobic magnesium-protoporphyrin IX monomethyl ester cyclase